MWQVYSMHIFFKCACCTCPPCMYFIDMSFVWILKKIEIKLVTCTNTLYPLQCTFKKQQDFHAHNPHVFCNILLYCTAGRGKSFLLISTIVPASQLSLTRMFSCTRSDAMWCKCKVQFKSVKWCSVQTHQWCLNLVTSALVRHYKEETWSADVMVHDFWVLKSTLVKELPQARCHLGATKVP